MVGPTMVGDALGWRGSLWPRDRLGTVIMTELLHGRDAGDADEASAASPAIVSRQLPE
jgi:hypothetical protein